MTLLSSRICHYRLLSINTIIMLLVRLLMEDRPFWWVREYGTDAPDLRQTPATCETGPGSPSGHVMGFAAILYALMRWATVNFINKRADLTYVNSLDIF